VHRAVRMAVAIDSTALNLHAHCCNNQITSRKVDWSV